ncbi:cysteine--tRNA ligase [Bacteroidota bacterium]
MYIYNTLTRKKEEFNPTNPPRVTFYMCGPTVYDFFHIGNARSFIMADMINRYLVYKGYEINFIMNLTDIDDRIIKRANEEKINTEMVAEKYSDAFFEDISKLKVKPAKSYPKATHHINQILEMIKKLVDIGVAYNIDGDVFYDISKFSSYGKLSGKNITDLEAGARVEINESKRHPLDFALWKKSKPDEPSWDSPWGKGRPGWHIECSAMSIANLGKTIDIHAGGSDLIFPHHENEIAQSEAATNSEFVKYWIHFGFLIIKEEKMSKSLGNFFTAREVLNKYSSEAIRLLFCQTHYRSQLNYSEELLKASEKGVENFRNLIDVLNQKLKSQESEKKNIIFNFGKYRDDFESAMDDDFNTPKATSVIFDFVHDINKVLSQHKNVGIEFVNKVKEFIFSTAENVLGIVGSSDIELYVSDNLTKELIEILLDIRLRARAEKKYDLADEIRDRLSEVGVSLKDTENGTTYRIN